MVRTGEVFFGSIGAAGVDKPGGLLTTLATDGVDGGGRAGPLGLPRAAGVPRATGLDIGGGLGGAAAAAAGLGFPFFMASSNPPRAAGFGGARGAATAAPRGLPLAPPRATLLAPPLAAPPLAVAGVVPRAPLAPVGRAPRLGGGRAPRAPPLGRGGRAPRGPPLGRGGMREQRKLGGNQKIVFSTRVFWTSCDWESVQVFFCILLAEIRFS